MNCVILKREAEGLDWAPVPGELGQKIYETVSKEGWAMWTARQTMIINEYRLNLADERAQKLLMEEMEAFFYGAGVAPPPGYVPQQPKSAD